MFLRVNVLVDSVSNKHSVLVVVFMLSIINSCDFEDVHCFVVDIMRWQQQYLCQSGAHNFTTVDQLLQKWCSLNTYRLTWSRLSVFLFYSRVAMIFNTNNWTIYCYIFCTLYDYIIILRWGNLYDNNLSIST